MEIPGYTIQKVLFESGSLIVYDAIDRERGRPVAIKTVKTGRPSKVDLDRIENEFRISKFISGIDGVPGYYDLVNLGYKSAVIMEKYNGITIKQYRALHPFDLNNFLDIAIKIAKILGDIHQRNVIHKNISPHSILIDPDSGDVRIVDFSIASLAVRERQSPVNPKTIEGMIQYISPEQTGRMNRSIDFRSDYYSLGIALFEFACGKPPFHSNDLAELIYHHLAVQPRRPNTMNKKLPGAVSDIIMKLISKNAEDRYQTSQGIVADLLKCRSFAENDSAMENFSPGESDISRIIQIPEKIYGREKQITALFGIYEKSIRGRKEVVFVSGVPGIGKTSFILEIQKPIIRNRGIFITGKFNQFKHNIPYYSFIQAFRDLISQLLTEDENQLLYWREKICGCLGSNGKVLVDILPELELIIGRQPEIETLPPLEHQKRLNHYLLSFIKVFAQKEHPLVFFLDDLQWADSVTLKLVENILKDKHTHYFMLICAYRNDDKTGFAHITDLIEELRSGDVPLETVNLDPLTNDDIQSILMDLFAIRHEDLKRFSDLVAMKTGGNPFFIKEYINTIYSNNLITYDNGWSIDLGAISRIEIRENVADLILSTIEKLPEFTRKLLQTASCFDSVFDLSVLSIVHNCAENEIFSALIVAIDQGLIIKNEEIITFSHDRIHEAVYNSIDNDLRIRMHYLIGNILLEKAHGDIPEKNIFNIAHQFNHASNIINDKNEEIKIAKINLLAGIKAKQSAAYPESLYYLTEGARLVPDDIWHIDYVFALSLYSEMVEVNYLVGNHRLADSIFMTIIVNVKNPLDKLRLYETRIISYTSLHKQDEALKIGIDYLKILGIKMPPHAKKTVLLKELVKSKILLRKMKIRKADDLSSLPEMTDPYKIAISRILMNCTQPSYIGVPDYFPIVVLKMLNLSLQHGISLYTSYAYVIYGVILCSFLGDISKGFGYGQLALKVLRKYSAKGINSWVYFVYGTMINHWKRHIKNDIDYLIESYISARENGYHSVASYAINHIIMHRIFAGESLNAVNDHIYSFYDPMKSLEHLNSTQVLELWYQFVVCLRGNPDYGTSLSGDFFNEEIIVNEWKEGNNITNLGFYLIAKGMFLYLNEAFAESIQIAHAGRKYLESIVGMFIVPEYHFYYALSMLAAYPEAAEKDRRRYVRSLKRIKKMMRRWSADAPMNYEHKYLLIDAGLTAMSGSVSGAIDLYDRAIETAKANGFLHDEAIANECAARYLISSGMGSLASGYIKEAYYLYDLWGVQSKLKNFKERYQDVISDLDVRQSNKSAGPESISELDINTVMKASHAISGEIEIGKLNEKLIKIILENAGARRGVLLLEREGELYLQAECHAEKESITMFQSIAAGDYEDIPRAIINYIKRTKEAIVLNDALKEGLFKDDPYIRDTQARSILCVPLIKQQELKGIVYLENNLTVGAFPPERQEIVKLLSTQAAISIENALLFDRTVQNEQKLVQNYEDIQAQYEEMERMNEEITDTYKKLESVNRDLARESELMKKAEDTLRESEERYRLLVETMKEGLCMLDVGNRVTYINTSIASLMGYDLDEITGRSIFDFIDRKDAMIMKEQLESILRGDTRSFEINLIRKDSSIISTIISPQAIYNAEGEFIASFGVISDITEKKKAIEEHEAMQRQLLQSQKMEAIGNLAGGVAHDFNNLLTAILGYGNLLMNQIDSRDERHDLVKEIINAAERSAVLTRQLLTFSRKQIIEATVFDLNRVVTDIEKMLRRLIGEDIRVEIELDESIQAICADRGQIEQVLMNLVVNARDAMPSGGKLTVKTGSVTIADGKIVSDEYISPGKYVSLIVRDDGMGMNEELIQNIFEPFFTTKDASKGTGLGLSVVYGIVKQHGGYIHVTSRPNEGSSFEIYLPAAAIDEETTAGENVQKEYVHGNGVRILLVEDQLEVMKFTSTALQHYGYAVHKAESVKEAFEVFQSAKGRIDILLCDVVLPDGNGLDVANRILEQKKDLKIIMTSGYMEQRSQFSEIKEKGYTFIQKPYSLDTLLHVMGTISLGKQDRS